MIKLANVPTSAPKNTDKDEIKKETKKLIKRLGELQRTLYAEKKHSVLVVLQGMDATGKDGATRKVFNDCTHVGLRVESFKKPTEEESAHDFLWRIHKHTPAKGMMQIFNRSHYEDVVIQRVHQWISEDRIQHRYNAINAFETLLIQDNDTLVVKFYMHISRKRQQEKLQERIDDPTKNWKHNDGDWEEAKLWDEYMDAYERAINHSAIEWHIVPVDQRWYRDYCIAKIMVEKLENLNMQLPTMVTTVADAAGEKADKDEDEEADDDDDTDNSKATKKAAKKAEKMTGETKPPKAAAKATRKSTTKK